MVKFSKGFTIKFLLLVTFLFSLVSCEFVYNFYEIEEGKYYRTQQLSGKYFQKVIDEHKIKTIINLRGEKPEQGWYVEEVEVAKKNNVNLINIEMSAGRLPHRSDLIKLLNAFRDAPRPLLVHCLGGSDRTGLASAIYQILYMDKNLEEALEMLTPQYLHFSLRFPNKTYFMRKLWQGEEWAREEYKPCSGKYKYYDSNSGACKPPHYKSGPTKPEDDT